MEKNNIDEMLENLQEAKLNYMSAIAAFEDNIKDQSARSKVSDIIQETLIHEQIALDTLS